jgi:hypothetical protein
VNKESTAFRLLTPIWRLPAGVLLALATVSMATTEHMCGAGYKWFEHYSPFFVGVGALVSVLACRRTVVGVTVAMLIGGVFDFVVWPRIQSVDTRSKRSDLPRVQDRRPGFFRICV